MPLDPSISLQAGQGVAPQVSPLAMAGQYQGLANAMQQNKLIGANIDATQAGTAQTQQATSASQQAQAQSAQMAQAQTLGDWLGLPTPLRTQGSAIQLTDYNLQKGVITPQEHDASVAAIKAAPDQASLDQLGHMALLHTMVGPARTAEMFGINGNQADGQSITPGVYASPMAQKLNGAPAFTPTQGAIPQLPSMGDMSERVIVKYDPVTHAPIYGPKSSVTPTSLGGTAGGPAPGGIGNGRFPDALRNPGNQQSVPPPGVNPQMAPTPDQAAGIVSGALGPADAAALAAKGSASAAVFQQIADQGTQARSQNATLGNMLADTAGFASGQTNLNSYKATLAKYAPALGSFLGVDPKSVADNESFDKLSNQIASQQGAGTDARLAVTQGANPSSHLSPAGVDQIIRQLQGNADYLSARAKLAANYPNQTDRAGFEDSTGNQLDPRAFQFERMTSAQKTAYVSKLSATDRAKVQSSYNYAANRGLIGGQNGAQ